MSSEYTCTNCGSRRRKENGPPEVCAFCWHRKLDALDEAKEEIASLKQTISELEAKLVEPCRSD